MNKYSEVYEKLELLISYDDSMWDVIEKYPNLDIEITDVRKVINLLKLCEKDIIIK